MLILLAVLFGTPGRDDRPGGRAQPPATPPRPPAAARDPTPRRVPFPVPARAARLDLSQQTAEAAAAKSAGCISCHQGQHDPHGKPETVRLGCVDCHGGNPQADDQQRGPRLAAVSRRLGKLGQPGPVVHAL